jgi:diguanylate cyclase (GGDEF)-like protein
MNRNELELYFNILRNQAEEHLWQSNDMLTGLPNNTAFEYMASEELLGNPQLNYALVMLDFEQFKILNELCGRSKADGFLKYVAAVLRGEQREHVIISRIFADVFVMLTTFDEKEDLIDLVERIDKRIAESDMEVKLFPSFGITISDHVNFDVSDLMDEARMAIRTIKGQVFCRYAFFDKKMYDKMLTDKAIENDIVDALEKEQLFTYIQPKVNMMTGEIVGGEALVRWNHPDKGLIPPALFMPVIEKNGQVIDVDMYVCRQLFEMIHQRLEGHRKMVPISINMSRMHVYDKKFRQHFMDLIDEYMIPTDAICLELTESAFLENGSELYDRMYDHMKFFRGQGFKLSMDDYGTGYSTMEMLKYSPMDEVKLDKGFIDDLANPKSRMILKHIIAMLHSLKVDIVVEGVETKEQQDFVMACGCKIAQGFYYYRPMPKEKFVALLDGDGSRAKLA